MSCWDTKSRKLLAVLGWRERASGRLKETACLYLYLCLHQRSCFRCDHFSCTATSCLHRRRMLCLWEWGNGLGSGGFPEVCRRSYQSTRPHM